MVGKKWAAGMGELSTFRKRRHTDHDQPFVSAAKKVERIRSPEPSARFCLAHQPPVLGGRYLLARYQHFRSSTHAERHAFDGYLSVGFSGQESGQTGDSGSKYSSFTRPYRAAGKSEHFVANGNSTFASQLAQSSSDCHTFLRSFKIRKCSYVSTQISLSNLMLFPRGFTDGQSFEVHAGHCCGFC